jgi:hypothetical protein
MSNTIRKCQNLACSNIETQFGDFKHCANCKITVYCSPECQKIDWKKGNHKNKCKIEENFTLRKYLQEKSPQDKIDTRGERIGRYAYNYFAKNASITTEQYMIVKIDMISNVAKFSLCEKNIEEMKKFCKEKCNIDDNPSLVISIMDVKTSNVEVVTISTVTKFNKLLPAPDNIYV